jgi:hypothetical protein
MQINEGGLTEHRSERQAPRRSTRTIVLNAVAEPPCERSVFGEPARRTEFSTQEQLELSDTLKNVPPQGNVNSRTR